MVQAGREKTERENSDGPNRDEQARESKATQISVGGAVLDSQFRAVKSSGQSNALCVMQCRETGAWKLRAGLGVLFLFLFLVHDVCACVCVLVLVSLSLALCSVSVPGQDRTRQRQIKSRPGTVHTPECSNSTGREQQPYLGIRRHRATHYIGRKLLPGLFL